MLLLPLYQVEFRLQLSHLLAVFAAFFLCLEVAAFFLAFETFKRKVLRCFISSARSMLGVEADAARPPHPAATHQASRS